MSTVKTLNVTGNKLFDELLTNRNERHSYQPRRRSPLTAAPGILTFATTSSFLSVGIFVVILGLDLF